MRPISARWRQAAPRTIGWVGFFAAVLAAWVVLWAMAQDRGSFSGSYGLALLADLCRADAGALSFGSLWAMWVVMSAAMMAPTAVPAIATWTRLPRGGSGGAAGTAALLAGYLAVWALASGGFALAQGGLAARGLLAPDGASLSLALTAGLFALAGAYQFSRLKAACLSQCRAPLTFFLGHWRPGIAAAMRQGVRLGLVCLGCCWALMALAFVGGMANLLWMGLATVLMVMEKLPEAGRALTRPLGWVLLALAVYTGVSSIGDMA